MEFRIVNKEEYYDTLVKWWLNHNFPVLKLSNLPETIAVASDEEGDVCAIPVYRSDSDFCYLGFITMNPSAKLRSKAVAIPFLTEKISYLMKVNGYDRLLITCNVSGIMKNLTKSGFDKIDETNYYLKNI